MKNVHDLFRNDVIIYYLRNEPMLYCILGMEVLYLNLSIQR
jgi:hypothetical protein